jgi:hypothetical protein
MALTAQRPVEPRPLHNEDGTLRALARQMLADLDETSEETPVRTATLKLLLSRLCDALADSGPAAHTIQQSRGGLLETSKNPNLAYWERRLQEDEDRISGDSEP